MSSEIKLPARTPEDPALVTTPAHETPARMAPALAIAGEERRLSWPAAALIIVALSVAGWLVVALLIGRLLR